MFGTKFLFYLKQKLTENKNSFLFLKKRRFRNHKIYIWRHEYSKANNNIILWDCWEQITKSQVRGGKEEDNRNPPKHSIWIESLVCNWTNRGHDCKEAKCKARNANIWGLVTETKWTEMNATPMKLCALYLLNAYYPCYIVTSKDT